jgi:hypothetical protein
MVLYGNFVVTESYFFLNLKVTEFLIHHIAVFSSVYRVTYQETIIIVIKLLGAYHCCLLQMVMMLTSVRVNSNVKLFVVC